MQWLPVVNEVVIFLHLPGVLDECLDANGQLIHEKAKRRMVGQHAEIFRRKFVALAHFIM